MLSYAATTTAPADTVWRLLAEPAQWHRWAPHVRAGRGLGDPEVQAGCRGTVRVWPALPVPVAITGKADGEWWDWRVAGVDMRHAVRRGAGGCEAVIEIRAPGPLERVIALSYGPVVGALLRNLVRVAERDG
jgi:hypothetical protein